MKTLTSNKAFWLLLVICVVTILPFLGLPEYHTKGEPRESIVSYSMLESDNWILPRNNGGEIPYKPPFFHWTIAAVSTLNGGQVTEMTSRLPSAIALISMTLFGFLFFRRFILESAFQFGFSHTETAAFDNFKLGLFDFNVRFYALGLNRTARRRIVTGRGQAHGTVFAKRDNRLNRTFAERLFAHDDCPFMILQSTGENFRRRGRTGRRTG